MTSKPRLLVDIVSDPVCPWCYVGLKSFAAAREMLAEDYDVLPRFRPYQLNPDTPETGADRIAYYEKKFPDPAFRDEMAKRLVEAAGLAGFDFDPSIPSRLPNTLKAHQVIHWAHFAGLQEPLTMAMYNAFWEDDADLGDVDALTAIAGAAGLNPADVARKLASGEDREAVRQEADAFRQAGVTGVPTFIANERTGFSGALPPDNLAAALARAAAPEAAL